MAQYEPVPRRSRTVQTSCIGAGKLNNFPEKSYKLSENLADEASKMLHNINICLVNDARSRVIVSWLLE